MESIIEGAAYKFGDNINSDIIIPGRYLIHIDAKTLSQHAFEVLGCIAVEYRTAFYNQQSRRAIERLGAKLDGILRNHQRYANGTLRDTCVYSIIASEWPTVKAHLQFQVERT